MDRLQAFAPAVLVVLTFALVAAAPVEAQPFDHLKCHKVKDPHKMKGVVDPDPALQQQFADQGCKIARGKLFCAPVEKNNVQVQPPPAFPWLGGQDLANDFMCYKVKCPNPPPDTQVTDQFATRTLTKIKAQFLCAPAYKGTPPTTTTTSITTTTTRTTTTTVVGSGMCDPLTSVYPTCSDQCPPGEVCTPNAVTQVCECVPTGGCNQATPSPQCDALCPPGEICAQQGVCQGTAIPCFADSNCSPPGTLCVALSTCACFPSVGIGCGALAGAPQCYGDCAAGQICVDLSSTCQCQ